MSVKVKIKHLKPGTVFKEKFPKWLNAEDLEALCLFVVTANLFEHYSYEWLQYNKPKWCPKINTEGR